MNSGPFHTDREALAASLYHQQGRPQDTDVPTTALNLADLTAALSGVELGDWDKRIIEWLAGWEPSTVAVVCGLITRARAATLPTTDLRAVLAALDEAADGKRDRAANCPDCTDQSCGTCQYRLHTAQAYDNVAGRLQHTQEATLAGTATAPPSVSREPGSEGVPEIGETQQREAGG
jgi:hypothetical protein